MNLALAKLLDSNKKNYCQCKKTCLKPVLFLMNSIQKMEKIFLAVLKQWCQLFSFSLIMIYLVLSALQL